MTTVVSPTEGPASATASSSPLRAFRAALAESRVAALASLALLAVGVALRLHLYLDRRSLWLDEIWVTLNVLSRSFLGLARPLDFDQTAPVGFLWIERLAVMLGGANELALRAFPFLASCLFLVLLWMLARRLLDTRGAALCLALAALSPLLIYYSNEVKPYGPDALAAGALIWLTLDVLDEPESRRAWRRLAVGGVLAMLLSTPSVFVLVGVGAALAAKPAIGRTRIGWVRLVIIGAIWLSIFALGYFMVYRSAATSAFMQGFWTNNFLSLPPRTLVRGVYDASRFMLAMAFFGRYDGELPRKVLTLATLVSAVGTVSLLRRRGVSVMLLVTLPFLVTGLASLAHRWPLHSRLLIFLMPGLVLVLVTGMWTITGALPARARGASLALLGALVVLPAFRDDARIARAPNRRDDVAPLVRDFMGAHARPSLMYVMAHAAPSWLYYSGLLQQRGSEAFRVATERAYLSAKFPHRACITQEPGLRVVFGPWATPAIGDSALAGEAAWLLAQPEGDVWVLTLDYGQEPADALARELVRQGATQLEERTRQGGGMRHFRLP